MGRSRRGRFPLSVSGLHLAAHNGHRDVVQLLLGTYRMDVGVRDMFAAENGHKELMASLCPLRVWSQC